MKRDNLGRFVKGMKPEENFNWKGGKIEIACLNCEQKMEIFPSQIKNKNFCSRVCLAQWRSLYKSGIDSPKWTRIEIRCEICEKIFTVKLSESKKRRFCSRKCADKHHSKIMSGKNHFMYGITGENHPLYNTHLTQETKDKQSKAKMGEKNPNYGKSTWNKNIPCFKQTKEKIRMSLKRKWMLDEDYRNAMMKSRHIKPNKKELQLIRLFQKNNLPYKFVGDGTIWINGKNPDFINTNHQKKIIELYGDYWHKDEKLKNGGDDGEERKEIFAKYGYQTLIIWEHELDDKQALLEKIKLFEENN